MGYHATSNPVPGPARYVWTKLADGRLVGFNKRTLETITIQPVAQSPMPKPRVDRGTINGKPAPRKAKENKQGERVGAPGFNAYVPKRHGFKQPTHPSWRAQIAGWSLEHRIERGPPSLFDLCMITPSYWRPTIDPPSPYVGTLNCRAS